MVFCSISPESKLIDKKIGIRSPPSDTADRQISKMIFRISRIKKLLTRRVKNMRKKTIGGWAGIDAPPDGGVSGQSRTLAD